MIRRALYRWIHALPDDGETYLSVIVTAPTSTEQTSSTVALPWTKVTSDNRDGLVGRIPRRPHPVVKVQLDESGNSTSNASHVNVEQLVLAAVQLARQVSHVFEDAPRLNESVSLSRSRSRQMRKSAPQHRRVLRNAGTDAAAEGRGLATDDHAGNQRQFTTPARSFAFFGSASRIFFVMTLITLSSWRRVAHHLKVRPLFFIAHASSQIITEFPAKHSPLDRASVVQTERPSNRTSPDHPAYFFTASSPRFCFGASNSEKGFRAARAGPIRVSPVFFCVVTVFFDGS